MCDGVARNSVHLGCGIDHIDPVHITQNPSCNLSWSGLLSGLRGSKSKSAAGADVQDAADDSLLAHADAYRTHDIAALLEQAHHLDVVGQRLSCGNDLDVIHGQ